MLWYLLFINVTIWMKGSNDANVYQTMNPQKEPLKTSKRIKNIRNSFRNHIIMILVNHNKPGMSCNNIHGTWFRNAVECFKKRKLWKCIVFSNIWVFWTQSILKPDFCLENNFWNWTSGYLCLSSTAKRSFLQYGPYGFFESWRIELSLFSKVGP